MIRVIPNADGDGALLELKPRSHKSAMPELRLPVEFCHFCPHCGQPIHGLISEVPEDGKPWMLHRYVQPGFEHTAEQSFVNTIVTDARGRKGHYFRCDWHFSTGPLVDASQKTYAQSHGRRCRYIKAIWEADPLRRATRIIRHLRSVPSTHWNAEAQTTMENKLVTTLERLQQDPDALKQWIRTFETKSVIADDFVGKVAPVALLSRQDWSMTSLPALCMDALSAPV